VESGEPSGFARLITPTHAFVGYMHGKTMTMEGYGLFFKDKELVYNGFYETKTLLEN